MTADERRTGPPTGHSDLDTLADLHAGVLEGRSADRVREHVDGCRQCAATLEALDAVQGQLRSLPAPGMPDAVAARLTAALTDLRTERPARTGATAADPEDELARARLRRSRRLSRAIVAAAAAVVVIAAGGAIASVVRGGGTSETTSSAGGQAASAPTQPQSPVPGAKSAEGGPLANDSARPAVPEYDRASLRAALPTIAAQGAVPQATSVESPTLRAACATSIPGALGTLRGAERIRYEGRPAYVFVYADGDRLTGFVVTETCGSAPGRPATVLDTVS
jgi:hypothetical protein